MCLLSNTHRQFLRQQSTAVNLTSQENMITAVTHLNLRQQELKRRCGGSDSLHALVPEKKME